MSSVTTLTAGLSCLAFKPSLRINPAGEESKTNLSKNILIVNFSFSSCCQYYFLQVIILVHCIRILKNETV